MGSCCGEGWVGWVAGGKGVCGWWRGGGQLWWRGRYLGGGEARRRVWLVGRGGGGVGSCAGVIEQLWWVAEVVECNI